MHYIRQISLLLAVVAVGLVSAPASQAQNTIGNCDPTISEVFLDINNVRATIYNNGNLFWRGAANVYEVPKGSGVNANFASGIWIGGQVAGQLRLAGSTYGPYEFWAGPLNDDGSPPADCSIFDRIYKVQKEDVVAYNSTGVASPDLADWPTGLGAPTLDANGDPIDLTNQPLASRVDRKINLAAGERPDILGDQMTWWVMNDRGNQHTRTQTPSMGIEVHGSAFAFNTAGAIGNTTFYKYRIMYKGTVALENAYMGIFDDPDLGAAFDDYVGSDTTLGLGYVYNADNDDDGNYGAAPPAMGYDFFQGPLVNDNGLDDNGDGQIDEDNERLGMTAFAFYNNGGGVQGDPGNGADMYNYMKGRWKDGQRFTLGGNGLGFSNIPTSFMFPGNPPNFWSEFDSDGQGSAIAPADRRFVMATGPFTIKPQDEQTLVFGIVTSFGADNLDSVQKMKSDDALAQAVFDIDFALPSPPAAPRVTATVDNGSVLLEWGYNPTDNNYLNSYNVIDPLLSSDVTDNDYLFEGYNVFQYANTADQDGKLLAVYDVVNDITQVIEGQGLTFVTADGKDTGVQNFHQINGLTNYKDYEFGVQAYAYNATSGQKVYAGPVARVKVVPQKTDIIISDAAVAAARSNGSADIVGTSGDGNIGDGSISANVVNPAHVSGADYSVEFYEVDTDALGKQSAFAQDTSLEPGDIDAAPAKADGESFNKSASSTVITYDVVNTSSNTTVFDGTAVVAATGNGAPEGNDVIGFDGLSLTVGGAPNDIAAFLAVANAAGPIDPPVQGTFAFNGNGFPFLADGSDRPPSSQQVNGSTWGLATGRSSSAGQSGDYATFVARAMRNGWSNVVPYDFEMRFTPECYNAWRAAYDAGEVSVTTPSADGCYGYDRFNILGTGGWELQLVPFEVWRVGIATPDDPSDDVRMVVGVIDWVADGWGIDHDDHPVSGGTNDPQTDWSYWYLPENMTPGEAGYNEWLAETIATCYPDGGACHATLHGAETFARMVAVNWNGGDVAGAVYDADMPEAGTVFRVATTKPNQPGDSFVFSTDGLGARARTDEENRAAVDNIGITPNPYKGASDYEVSQLVDQVRFTNMPNTATIRIFTVAGTLIRTLEKNSASASFPWDLTTEDGLPIASGMYIIHVDSEFGEKVLKFGVVKKRVQLNTF